MSGIREGNDDPSGIGEAALAPASAAAPCDGPNVVPNPDDIETSLQAAPTEDDSPNPFEVNHDISACGCFWLILGSVFLLPIRVAVLLVNVIIGFILCLLLSCCCRTSAEDPTTAGEKCLLVPLQGVARVFLWCFGFWWISVDDQSGGELAPIMAAASHATIFDGVLFFYLCAPGNSLPPPKLPGLMCECAAVVAHDGVAKMPLFGPICKALGCIFVDRSSAKSRGETKTHIKDRAMRFKEQQLKPLLIFPEGFCTNGRCAVQFQRGAFTAMEPVTPVALHYPDEGFQMATTVLTNNGWFFYRCICRLHNPVTVVFLPVCQPTSDAPSFADKVRQQIATEREKLSGRKITLTAHRREDYTLCEKALGGRGLAASFTVDWVNQVHDLELEELLGLVDKFDKYDTGKTGFLTYDNFLTAIQTISKTHRDEALLADQTWVLFALFDR